MRTAVDSSVLLDIFSNSPPFSELSRPALLQAGVEGSLVACDVVWAEVRAHFPSAGRFEGAMAEAGIAFDPCDGASAEVAGRAWREYRKARGPRMFLIPDFLVAAHAQVRADRLLTRDRGFARRYFRKLEVLDPTAR